MAYSYFAYLAFKRTKSTRSVIRLSFLRFFTAIYPGDSADLDALSLRYLSEKRDYFADMALFVSSLADCSPNTIHGRVSSILYWLRWNDIILPAAEFARLKVLMPRKVTVHDEGEMTVPVLRSLLTHADVLMRAVLLVLASSGMRVGECLAMRADQLRGNEVHMLREQMKAGKPHVYFISREAMQAIAEWNKVRDSWKAEADVKTSRCLKLPAKDDARVFPYSYQVIASKFVSLQKAADIYEWDAAAKRARVTIHMIRKLADSVMCQHISKNETNALIGHFEPGDSAYRRYTREQLAEAYKKVEPYLTIMAPADYAELHSETREQLNTQNKILVDLVEDRIDLRKRLDSLERVLRQLSPE